ncbi:hypothetical protein Pcinc_004176 [Petrolisthes cinctipes]|uniref:Uncharacterized protein n=1 Tax=Petrolisthes cinctipes TaxID=88211 RepID=A0AAE1GHM4_PETCI|nr:hypothetical protein Pcinc_004176 [Petrolisthes cinctipes]
MQQPSDSDLWGPACMLSDVSSGFEDSFSPTTNENNNNAQNYIPLQDSSQYLAGLERKLAVVQGRASGQRKAESRRLIDALVGTRSAHVSQLVQNSEGVNEELGEEQTPVNSLATVDPQGALGVVLRRVAPDRVAVAPEELCRLLESDILAKVHQALQDTSDNHTTHNTEADDRKDNNPNKGMEKDFEKTIKSPTEQKDPSSDEGEK